MKNECVICHRPCIGVHCSIKCSKPLIKEYYKCYDVTGRELEFTPTEFMRYMESIMRNN